MAAALLLFGYVCCYQCMAYFVLQVSYLSNYCCPNFQVFFVPFCSRGHSQQKMHLVKVITWDMSIKNYSSPRRNHYFLPKSPLRYYLGVLSNMCYSSRVVLFLRRAPQRSDEGRTTTPLSHIAKSFRISTMVVLPRQASDMDTFLFEYERNN